MSWTHQHPQEPGFYLRLTSEGKVVLHRVWADDDGRSMIRWNKGAVVPVESVRQKLGWYWWYDTGARDIPSYPSSPSDEDSVSESNYE